MRRFLPAHHGHFTIAIAMLSLAVIGSTWSELAGTSSVNTGHPAIVRTAWIAAATWYTAMALRVWSTGWLFREVYAWGFVLFLLHVIVAFHLGHGWSHAEAFDHVERSSGFGPGIFVSYAFTAMWMLDAAWAMLAWNSYRARGRWWNVIVYGFMAFVVVNATVVFAFFM